MRSLRVTLITAVLSTSSVLFAAAPEPLASPFDQSNQQAPTSAAANPKPTVPARDALAGVKITWYGQSCFAIQDKVGHQVLTDPFDPKIGYPVPEAKPTIITVSHEHPDHNFVTPFPDFPQIIKKEGQTAVGGLSFQGLHSWHDNESGKRRGSNTIFIWKEGGLTFAHLGDLGQDELTKAQLTALRGVDVLFIPVGGHFTIDAATASSIVDKIQPRAVIPMHYKTPAVSSALDPVDNFLKGPVALQKVNGASLTLNKKSLPLKTTIYLLDYVSHQEATH